RADRLPKAFTLSTPAIDGGANTTPSIPTSIDVQTLCHPAYMCLTRFQTVLSRLFFAKGMLRYQPKSRSFSMQLSKKTAMLFFISFFLHKVISATMAGRPQRHAPATRKFRARCFKLQM